MIGRDSSTAHHREKVPGDDPQYKTAVAEPVMAAVDALPAPFRRLVHEFGYVDVYRAWRRGWTVEMIRDRAFSGLFVLA